jgi:hypothetical protein
MLIIITIMLISLSQPLEEGSRAHSRHALYPTSNILKDNNDQRDACSVPLTLPDEIYYTCRYICLLIRGGGIFCKIAEK